MKNCLKKPDWASLQSEFSAALPGAAQQACLVKFSGVLKKFHGLAPKDISYNNLATVFAAAEKFEDCANKDRNFALKRAVKVMVEGIKGFRDDVDELNDKYKKGVFSEPTWTTLKNSDFEALRGPANACIVNFDRSAAAFYNLDPKERTEDALGDFGKAWDSFEDCCGKKVDKKAAQFQSIFERFKKTKTEIDSYQTKLLKLIKDGIS